MERLVKFKNVITSLMAAGLLVAGASASAALLTYNVSRTIGVGSVTGTVTTDGTFGVLATANMVSWSLTLNDGTNNFAITEANSDFIALGAGLTADVDSLDFDFSGSNTVFDFQNPNIGSGINFWCGEGATGTTCTGSHSGEYVNAAAATVSAGRSGTVSIATRDNGVPEPATLVLVGMALIGAAASRRRC